MRASLFQFGRRLLSSLPIITTEAASAGEGRRWAAQLGSEHFQCSSLEEASHLLSQQHRVVLSFGEESGLCLQPLVAPNKKQRKLALPRSVRVDFVDNEKLHRRLEQKDSDERVLKACGVKLVPNRHRSDDGPFVLDCTAGLGRDAAILAYNGCRVLLCERNPVIAALLLDGLQRAKQKNSVFAERISLLNADAGTVLENWMGYVGSDVPPDVVYLDPMLPVRKKGSLVKHDTQVLQAVLSDEDYDISHVFALGKEFAANRVVVKRPLNAEQLASPSKPGLVLKSKSCRFDVYFNPLLASADEGWEDLPEPGDEQFIDGEEEGEYAEADEGESVEAEEGRQMRVVNEDNIPVYDSLDAFLADDDSSYVAPRRGSRSRRSRR